jgi:SchA/CurD like domain-containing protein
VARPALPAQARTEQEVAELFRQARLSDLVIKDENGAQVGRMLSMMAFAGRQIAVRIVEIEGSLPEFIAHMSRSAEMGSFQRSLGQFLAVPAADGAARAPGTGDPLIPAVTFHDSWHHDPR